MSQVKHHARKRFGQHFLHDNRVVEDIIQAAEIDPEDTIVEIGPGKGILTDKLLQYARSVTAVEIDTDLAGHLDSIFGTDPKFKLIVGDILKTDWNRFIQPGSFPKLVANLPYNISTPLFFKLIEHRNQFKSAVLMVQKELARRLCHDGQAGKGLKDYGVLSVVAMNTFRVTHIRDVPPACFSPRPKIESTVVRLEPIAAIVADEPVFFRFVQRLFSVRRKRILTQIRKNEPELYDRLSDPTKQFLDNLRPENLSPAEYVKLFTGKELRND